MIQSYKKLTHMCACQHRQTLPDGSLISEEINSFSFWPDHKADIRSISLNLWFLIWTLSGDFTQSYSPETEPSLTSSSFQAEVALVSASWVQVSGVPKPFQVPTQKRGQVFTPFLTHIRIGPWPTLWIPTHCLGNSVLFSYPLFTLHKFVFSVVTYT